MRQRLRDLGQRLGRFAPGPLCAITDVPGVKVGHTTLISGSGKLEKGKGPVRTGVTAILPNSDVFTDRVLAGGFVLNGAGEMSGITQVNEWGLLETPILLTNSMSVGKVSDAAVKWLTKKHTKIGMEDDVILPLVGECDDSFLNDAVGRHIRSEHVHKAIDLASTGLPAEGSVGAGTGMMTCDFKAGIGTASRRITLQGRTFTVGVLVLSNFGVMQNLRIDGVPVGALLEPEFAAVKKRENNYGSIIAVVATDVPLLPSQLQRVSKRAALGIGRVGSHAAHGSGEIILAFSTANRVPRFSSELTTKVETLFDSNTAPLYESTIEATEEAIVNSLCMADDMTGINDNFAPGLPLERVVALLEKHRPTLP